MTVSEQGKIFCIFFVVGLLIGFIFDIFRSFRKNFKTPDFLVTMQDVAFLLISRNFNIKKYNCFQ